VDTCLQRQDLMDSLKARAEAANTAYGIDSTPSLVIDGKLYAGDMSYDSLKPKLDEALAADRKK
jgi:protein-disulfide isomerase